MSCCGGSGGLVAHQWWFWWNIVAIYAQTPSSVLTHAAPALKEIFHWLPSRHHRNDHHPKLCVT